MDPVPIQSIYAGTDAAPHLNAILVISIQPAGTKFWHWVWAKLKYVSGDKKYFGCS